MKKVIVEARPHVVIQGEIMVPDCLGDETIIDYLRERSEDIDYDWTPIAYDFEGTEFNLAEIDGEMVWAYGRFRA